MSDSSRARDIFSSLKANPGIARCLEQVMSKNSYGFGKVNGGFERQFLEMFGDDDEYEDFDDDDDDEDDSYDLFFDNPAFVPKEQTVVIDEKDIVEKQLHCDRDNVRIVVQDHIDTGTVGKIDLIAKPGCGKTRIIPQLLSEKASAVICVVPNATNLAAVGADLNMPNLVSCNGKRLGVVDLQYVTRETIQKTNMKPQQETVIVVDEAQELTPMVDEALVLKLQEFQKTSLVIYEHGNYSNESAQIPENVETFPHRKFSDSSGKKVLVVHPDERSLPRTGGEKVVLRDNLLQDIDIFGQLKRMSSYQLHCTIDQTKGLHLDLDEVYAPEYIFEGRVRRNLTNAEHFQLACRLGRFGRSGSYFGKERICDLRIYEKPRFTYKPSKFVGCLSSFDDNFRKKKEKVEDSKSDLSDETLWSSAKEKPRLKEKFQKSSHFVQKNVMKDSFQEHVGRVISSLPCQTEVVWNNLMGSFDFRQPVYLSGVGYTWICNSEQAVMSNSIDFLKNSLETSYLHAVQWQMDNSALMEMVALYISLYSRLVLERKVEILRQYSCFHGRKKGDFDSCIRVLRRIGPFFTEIVGNNVSFRCFSIDWKTGENFDLNILVL